MPSGCYVKNLTPFVAASWKSPFSRSVWFGSRLEPCLKAEHSINYNLILKLIPVGKVLYLALIQGRAGQSISGAVRESVANLYFGLHLIVTAEMQAANVGRLREE